MAALTRTGVATLVDVASRISSDGGVLSVIDVLSEHTIFGDAHIVEANDFTSHHYSFTLTQPTGSDTIVSQGVTIEIGTESPVTEMIQGFESYSLVDDRIVRLDPHPDEFRKRKDMSQVRGMAKSIDDRFLYGGSAITGSTSSVSGNQIQGLTTRFNKLSPTTYNYRGGSKYWSSNVVSNGGSTSNAQSSVWFIEWSDDGVFVPVPRNFKNVVEVLPKDDITTIFPTTGTAYDAWVTHFYAAFGLCVGDWRRAIRLANIDATTTLVIDDMIAALGVYPDSDWSKLVMYCGKQVWIQFQQAAIAAANGYFFMETPWGKQTPSFMGIPIVRADRLVDFLEPVVS